jgi:hypothetical protein
MVYQIQFIVDIKDSYKVSQGMWLRNKKVKVGDKVRVFKKIDLKDENELNWGQADDGNIWVDLMDECVGKEFIINNIDPNLGIGLKIDGLIYFFPYFVLRHIRNCVCGYNTTCPCCGAPAIIKCTEC